MEAREGELVRKPAVWGERPTCRGKWPRGWGATAAPETQGQWLSPPLARQGPQGEVGMLGVGASEDGLARSLRGSFGLPASKSESRSPGRAGPRRWAAGRAEAQSPEGNKKEQQHV